MPKLTAYVISVIDGDTFKTRHSRIRIAGINAPEANTASGRNATNYLKFLIEHKEIVYDSHATDVYGRKIATVWRKSDNLNIGIAMIKAGHARRS